MKEKWNKYKLIVYILLVCAGLLIGQHFLYRIQKNALETKLEDIFDKKKKVLIKEIDSLDTVIIENAEKGKERFDSIVNIEPKVKYIKYEKTIFIDRTIDANLTILAD